MSTTFQRQCVSHKWQHWPIFRWFNWELIVSMDVLFHYWDWLTLVYKVKVNCSHSWWKLAQIICFVYYGGVTNTHVLESNTYSALKPFTCSILICLTIVLFPDSPAPKRTKKGKKNKKKNKPCTNISLNSQFSPASWISIDQDAHPEVSGTPCAASTH